MNKRLLCPVSALAVSAVIIAGCGGNGATATPVASTPTPLPTARSVPPTATPPAPTPTPVATPTPPPSPTATAKYGGVLQLRAQFQPNLWWTYDSRTGAEWPYTTPLFSYLIVPDAYNESVVVGDLAESWTIGRVGAEYTFKLRKNATWADGVPVTSADIAYSLTKAQAVNPNPPSAAYLRTYMKGVTDITAVDNQTVKVTLGSPSASFLQRLGIRPFLMYPAHLPLPDKWDQFRQSPVGSGPYKLKEFSQSNKFEYVRNQSYFKPGLPYLDGINYTFVPAAENALAGFRTGRFMATVWDDQVFQNAAPDLQKVGYIIHLSAAGRSDLLFNQRAPWTDQRVRQAVSMGFNRKVVLDTWLKGVGTTLASPLLPPELGGQWGLPASEMRKRPGFPTATDTDIVNAKQLLQQAGVNPSTILIQYDGISTFRNLGAEEAMGAGLEQLGFRVDIQILESANSTARKIAGNFDIAHSIRSINLDDPLDSSGIGPVLTGDGQNYPKWSDPELDSLAGEQDRTLDPVQRKALIAKLQTLFLDRAYSVPILYRNYYNARLPFVKNVPLPRYTFSPSYQWEQVWLDR